MFSMSWPVAIEASIPVASDQWPVWPVFSDQWPVKPVWPVASVTSLQFAVTSGQYSQWPVARVFSPAVNANSITPLSAPGEEGEAGVYIRESLESPHCTLYIV